MSIVMDDFLIEKAVKSLKRGEIIAFPTETVYAMAAIVENEDALKRLFALKRREVQKVFSLHLADLSLVDDFIEEPLLDLLFYHFLPGPLTIVVKSKKKDFFIAEDQTVGLRIPSHPIAQKILKSTQQLVVASSINLSGQKPCQTKQEILQRFPGVFKEIIEDSYPVANIASTVVRIKDFGVEILREGPISKEELEKVCRVW